jgi:hypothetical protein
MGDAPVWAHGARALDRPIQSSGFRSFREFYPFYLSQHVHPVCRRLHVVGTSLVIALFIAALLTRHWWLLLLLPVAGYVFAWVGHFFFEKNRPATFTNPVYSLAGDFVMWWDVVRGRVR